MKENVELWCLRVR